MYQPKDLYESLDRYVKGQEYAKKVISVAVYDHYIRCLHPELEIKKSNIIMIGPSGCGKTYIIECASKLLKLPLAIADATSLTQAGYIGEDVENCLIQLLDAANGDVELAQRGIVFVDEIDKLAKKGVSNTGGRDISGEGVQQSLLKLIEGANIKVNLDMFSQKSVMIDTSNILFICAGAFEDKVESYKVSFEQSLIDYGMTKELLGRLHIKVLFEKLSEKNMYEILVNCADSIIDQYIRLFDFSNCKLSFTDEALNLIAKFSQNSNSGARFLRTILEAVLLDYQFQFPDCQEVNIDEFKVIQAIKSIEKG